MVRLNYEEAHEVLEIQVGASEDQVKKAYKRRALACHPDRNPGDPEAKERFQRVSAAYKRISEPEAEEENGDEQGFNEDDLMNMFMSIFFAGGRPGGGFPGGRGSMPMPGFFGGFSVNDFGDDSDEEEDSDDDDDDDDDDDPLRNLLFAHMTMGSMFGGGMDHDDEEEEDSDGDDKDEYYRHCMDNDDAEMFIRAAMVGGIFGMSPMGEMNMGGHSSRDGGRGGYRGRGSSRNNAGFPAPRRPGPSPSASSSRRGRGGSMNVAGSAGRGGAGAGRGGRWGETAPAQQAQQAQPQGDSKSKKKRERRRRNKGNAQAGEGGGAAAGANPSRAAGGPNVYRK